MKVFWKVFLSFYILIAVIFSLCTSFILQASFKSDYQREVDVHLTENEMYRVAFVNALTAVPEEYQKKRETVENIARSLYKNTEITGKYFAVRDGRINLIYQSHKEGRDDELSRSVSTDNRGYRVYEADGHRRIRVISAARLQSTGKTYYLETISDMDTVYEQRKDMIRLYQYVVCILLGACVGISLALSYLLTHRLSKLSESTGRLAGGDLDSRAEVRGKDEIAVLAQDFNSMASHLQEKMQELSAQAKHQERFTAAFAHELKTPLTAIIGYAELIRSVDDLSPEERIKAADYIYAQGKRLQKLSYKLMELFTLRQQDMEMQKLPAPYLLRQVSYLVEVGLLRAGIELEQKAEKGYIFGEPDLLISLFANLIDNARKASAEGSHIYLTGCVYEEGYIVTVRDEGKGMEPEEIKKITQAFYMVNKSRSRKEGGAGLGMTLCQEIIRLHNARWTIESQPGKGTTITMYFPSKEEEQ